MTSLDPSITLNTLRKSLDIEQFKQRSDRKGAILLLNNWLAIVAILAITMVYSHPLIYLIAIVLLGGRMLGLAVLMHDCGHRTLFKTQKYNDIFGNWLCAYPLLTDMNRYAQSHLQHHRMAGTEQDPDLSNYRSYPISKQSFRNKMVRDLTGQTGIKLIKVLYAYNTGEFSGDARITSSMTKSLLVQATFIAVTASLGHLELYLLWAVAYLTVYTWVLRIRQIAEHANVPELFSIDPRKNTRTTLASWWERLLFAPNFVNYHVEHHTLASVPCYNLREFHQYLMVKNFFAEHPPATSYAGIMKEAIA